VAWFLGLLDSRGTTGKGAEQMSTSPTPPSTNQPPTWPVTPPEPKRRGRVLLAAAIGVVLLVATGCVATSGATDTGPDPTPPTTPSSGPADPPGDPAPRSDPPKEDPEPTAVVRDYYAAINAHDYGKAWRLGGKNFSRSYEDFVGGFADTEHDTLTVQNVDGPIVTIRLVADQAGGRRSVYQGTYTVEHGELVAAQIRRVSGPPPTTHGPNTTPAPNCDPSYPDECLDPAVEDYDCAGGSGNGPEYVKGPIRVRLPDPFDLDRDGDGLGCDAG
jgi:hypothetical protein